MKRFNVIIGVPLFVMSAVGLMLMLAAETGHMGDALFYSIGLAIAATCVTVMNYSTSTFEQLAEEWIIRTTTRRAIAFQRAYVLANHSSNKNLCRDMGATHARANGRVVELEEEMIYRFAGQSCTLLDGRRVEVGTPGCRLHDRIRVIEVPSTLKEE